MMGYDGDQARYAAIVGHGFRMLAEAMEADLPYPIDCPALLICGERDRAGSCIRYNKAWHKKTGIRLEWIKGAGHNSNTDAPEQVNRLIEELLHGLPPVSLLQIPMDVAARGKTGSAIGCIHFQRGAENARCLV